MTIADLQTIHAAVEALTDFENQDPTLVIEMSQAMLADLIAGDSLAPVIDYVRRYRAPELNASSIQKFLDRQGAIDEADFEAWNGSCTPAEVLDAGDAAVAEVNMRRGRM